MRDQETINKLQLLKKIHPTKHALLSIKKGVYQQVKSENRTQSHFRLDGQMSNISYLIHSYKVAFFASVIAFLFIVFLSASMILLPNQIHNAILYGRIALAQNQYEKAQVALDDTRNRFTNNKSVLTNTNELAFSLNMTNTELNKLKLKGEKGKYTAQQCHQIYKEYLSNLETNEKSIPSNNTTLKSKINVYEEQAETKLHMYPSL